MLNSLLQLVSDDSIYFHEHIFPFFLQNQIYGLAPLNFKCTSSLCPNVRCLQFIFLTVCTRKYGPQRDSHFLMIPACLSMFSFKRLERRDTEEIKYRNASLLHLIQYLRF